MRPRQNKGRLGAFLIERGLIRSLDLERALEIQRVAGGHLGTNLLELGVLEEDDLLEAISELHDHATVSGEQLRRVPKELASIVPRELVRRHSIVPFELHGNTVYIASQRPGDLHIENEVTLATSRLTRTFLGLEVRIQEALHRLHGHSFPLRFARLAAKLDGHELTPVPSESARTATPRLDTPVRQDPEDDSSTWISSGSGFDPTLSDTVGRAISWADFEEIGNAADRGSDTTEIPWQKKIQPVRRTKTAEPRPLPAEPGEKPPADDDATTPTPADADTVRSFPSTKRAVRPRRPNRFLESLERAKHSSEQTPPDTEVGPNELQDVSAESADPFSQVHEALLLAGNLDEIGAALMNGLRPFFRRRLLLAKRGQRLVGWRADGPGVRPKDLGKMSFSIERASPFLAIETGSRFWLGSYHHDAGHDAIHSVLGRRQAPDCMVMALRAGSHTVGFIYGDNEDATVTGQPLRKFLELAEAAGRSLERLVLARKRARKEDVDPSAAETKEIEKQPAPDPWAPREAS